MTAPLRPRRVVANDEKVKDVATRLTGLIKSIEHQGEPFVCNYHEGRANHSMNRRLVRFRVTRSGLAKSSGLCPNAIGDRHESVRLLELTRPSGKPGGILSHYARL